MNIYFIGGSPCSGKSTIAEYIAGKYGITYFKADDFLDKFIERGAKAGLEVCSKLFKMTPEQIWMREPLIQCADELAYYKEAFDFMLEELNKVNADKIITEGAAYLPELMKKENIPNNRYISITPTKDFQIFHYSKREWVPHFLEGCSDKDKAFSNWMDRDALFAEKVRKQCKEQGYLSIVNDGSISINALVDKITTHFELHN